MRLSLVTIPDVGPDWEVSHDVRALAIDGRSLVLDALAAWKKKETADYRKIMKVIERVARYDRVTDQNHVRADALKTGIYEMRAKCGKARLFFFYDDDAARTAIAVHSHWKNPSGQSRDFEHAALLMKIWKQSRK